MLVDEGLVTGVSFATVFIDDDRLRRRVSLHKVFHGGDQKSGCAAGWITDGLVGPRSDNLYHLADNVSGSTELPVNARRGKARNILACADRGNSPISSRNKVPVSAASK